MEEFLDVLNKVKDLGAYGLFSVVFYALHRRWYVPGWVLDAAVQDCDENLKKIEADRDWWRNVAMRGLDMTERAVAK